MSRAGAWQADAVACAPCARGVNIWDTLPASRVPDAQPTILSSRARMFEELKQRMRDLIDRATSPADRRTMIAMMRDAVVEAKVSVREMRDQLEGTRRRLTIERKELETVRRRARLAEQIDDAQTLQIAREYERRHGDRVEVLERKLAAQEAELNLAEREVDDMTRELKSRAAGVEPGGAAAEVGVGEVDGEGTSLPLEDPAEQGSTLRSEIDRMAREARASEMLAELKRRMGK